jgi:phosphatidate cytidylyltransferase
MNLFAQTASFRVLTDAPTLALLGGVLAVLAIAWGVGMLLRRQVDTTLNPAIVELYNRRVQAWLLMYVIFASGFVLGRGATTLLFFFVSFFALREFITITPTRLGDHRALFWVFFVFAPLQYLLIFIGPLPMFEHVDSGAGPHLYGLYSILLPVYAFLFIFTRVALAGDPRRFLERTAKIQAGLLICVYALSFAPALLYLNLDTLNTADGGWQRWEGSSAGLLFYFILIVQLSDMFCYAGSRMLGGEPIAADINASRTWRGFLFGLAMTSLCATALWWVTPFRWWESASMSMIVSALAFAGGMTMSAIKRDRGVKDYGTLVEGHAGILDRIDSLCFAAPVFFHLTRYFYMVLPLAQGVQ